VRRFKAATSLFSWTYIFAVVNRLNFAFSAADIFFTFICFLETAKGISKSGFQLKPLFSFISLDCAQQRE
jgi:hypothetical protein